MDADRLVEQRQRLPHAVFQQLFENVWTAAAGSFLDPVAIDAAFMLDTPTFERDPSGGFEYMAALDLGIVSDRTVVSIGHRDGDRVVLDLMRAWSGSRAHPVDFAEVEGFVRQAHERFGFSLRLDPWQGLDLAQRLRGAGVHAEEFSFTAASKQRLAASLLSTINSGNLALYEAEGLRDELLELRLVQSTSGAWSFDHRSSGHDDRAVALSLMVVALLERPVPSFDVRAFMPRSRVHPLLADGETHQQPKGLWRGARNGLTMFDEVVDGGELPDLDDLGTGGLWGLTW